ncbi:phage holin family protein [Klebsiella aerogenes]|uniref:phage holin family protein n=1 Tax=Klebsiella aerogenes TaxID=548 RepID=UPI0005EF209C|nr:phage holin family protein [Klebsiella aerogenes]KJO49430.1 hypothetical protein SR89_23155 [Klebsiella aerogenes]
MNNTIQEVLSQVMEWIKSYFPAICAGVMALTISWLMDMRAGKPKAFAACGALVCGLVATGLYSFAIYCGMPPEAGVFGGAFIGFYGADNLRDTIVIFGKRKVGGGSNASK